MRFTTCQDMLELHAPDARFRDGFFDAVRDYERAGEVPAVERYKAGLEDFDAYLSMLQAAALEVGLAPGRVPCRTFWLIEAQARVVGFSRLRPRLTTALESDGGHIGYDVPPALRRRGYGTQLLRLTLRKAAEAGLQQVLLTADADNLASIRVIEGNGGQLDSEKRLGTPPRRVRRYVIALTP